jgi:hypothetical protein
MEETPTLEEQPKSKPSTSEEEENVDNGDQYMPDAAQNPPSSPGSDGSDSDSESDSEDEAQQNLQLQTLEAELSSNPSNYDTHVQVFTLFAC